MPENWSKAAANWDQDEQVRSYADKAFASLLSHVNVCSPQWKSKRVLDFGCGTGLLTEKMIEVLKRKQLSNVIPNCVEIGNGTQQLTADWLADFDLIVASSVCSFLPNYKVLLHTLSNAIAPNGYFIQWDWLPSEMNDFGLTPARVERALNDANFAQVRVEQAFSVEVDNQHLPVLIGIGVK
ncbi:methyltransferase [Pseudovibrio japonicus]|uniref:Methyltransferase n=1 Tax=Pseudovibrio japonicus TaxID=366534 RepID=A0ABQ3ECF4_9HYPH|nr:methyltransferase domain-containing protein [Pseudovibrio japonicus]GHB33638.1 methyltransferase [Pseudovibrio japonicus]